MMFSTRRGARRPIRLAAATLAASLTAMAALVADPAEAASVNTASVDDVTVVEGNAGSTLAVVRVRFGRPAVGIERWTFTTASRTGIAGQDFRGTAGTIVPKNGQTSSSIAVPVFGDALDEPTETFEVRLVAQQNAEVADGTAIGTIVNDDGAPAELNVVGDPITEGDENATQPVVVALSHAVNARVTANWRTVAGTATAADFTPANGSLVFEPGVTEQTIPVAVVGDGRDETNETFSVAVTDVLNAEAGRTAADVSILDDDGAPAISVGDIVVAEGTGAPKAAVFDVALTPASELPVNVKFATVAADATRPVQGFTSTSGTVVFPAGSVAQTVSVPLSTDALDETDEAFYLNLSGAKNAIVDDPQATATIEDDDAAPTVVVAPGTVTEGSGAVVPFTARLSAPSGKPVSFAVTAKPGTAGAADFDPTATPISFAAYDTASTTPVAVNVAVVNDELDEADESLSLEVSDVVNANPPATGAAGTIVDDDATPSLAAENVTIGELDTEGTVAVVDVALSAVSGRAVSVDYTTVAGTATAGSDFTTRSGTLSIAAGDPGATIEIPIPADALDEDDESFTVDFSNPVNTNGPDDVTVTIVDADSTVNTGLADLSVGEGTGGTKHAVIPVTLSGTADRVVKVDYATTDGTATAGEYTATTGTLTFARGETTKEIRVPVTTDALDDFDETFTVTLSNPVNVEIADPTADVTIADDDAAPTFRFTSGTVDEPESADALRKIFVELSAPSGKLVSLDFTTKDNTARVGVDYVLRATRIDLLPGATRHGIHVKVLADSLDEPVEAIDIQYYRPVNATLADPTKKFNTVQMLVSDTDAPVPVSVADSSVDEGDSGTTNALFTVTLGAVSGLPVTVGYETVAEGTAAAGTDYRISQGSVTIPAGATSGTFAINAFADTLDEPDETFAVRLVNPTNATIADGTAVGTIVDNDVITVNVAGTQIVEGDSGSQNATVTVSMSGRSTRTVSATVRTVDGTALAGADYGAVSTTVTFAPGERTKTITVPVVGDTVAEDNETFGVEIADPVNGSAGAAGTVDILDND